MFNFIHLRNPFNFKLTRTCLLDGAVGSGSQRIQPTYVDFIRALKLHLTTFEFKNKFIYSWRRRGFGGLERDYKEKTVCCIDERCSRRFTHGERIVWSCLTSSVIN